MFWGVGVFFLKQSCPAVPPPSPTPTPSSLRFTEAFTPWRSQIVSLQSLLTHSLHQPCVPAWQCCPATATAGSSWHRRTGGLAPRPAAGRWSSSCAPARSVARRGTAAALQIRETRVQVRPESVSHGVVGRLAPSCRTAHLNAFCSVIISLVCLRPLCRSNVYLVVMETSPRQKGAINTDLNKEDLKATSSHGTVKTSLKTAGLQASPELDKFAIWIADYVTVPRPERNQTGFNPPTTVTILFVPWKMFGAYLSNWQADEGTSAQENLACVHKVELLALLQASGGKKKNKKKNYWQQDVMEERDGILSCWLGLKREFLENRTKPSSKWFISLKLSLWKWKTSFQNVAPPSSCTPDISWPHVLPLPLLCANQPLVWLH